ncbi:MAG: hypothetical protein C5B58_08575 [Acidobacteria bacterium]|nr:MAG: hypothetical protein C5B58_08575 [Acidobacteriota bacterium]
MTQGLISEADAVRLARGVAEKEVWTWLEPVEAQLVQAHGGAWQWNVCSNAGRRGVNVRIVMDAVSGDIIAKAFLPR